ncbi:MAG TPA: hypothetical protein VEA38_12070 [Terriglobales bacterium]|nr:hypothetical protein [Terriglobales bacterium]
MPWTVFGGLEHDRRNARAPGDRIQGACHDTIEALLQQTSALLRRRNSDDVTAVAVLLSGAPHCVPCIALVTSLDARRIYVALDRLKGTVNVELVAGRCRRCARETTVYALGS